jgi:hypothetical protein
MLTRTLIHLCVLLISPIRNDTSVPLVARITEVPHDVLACRWGTSLHTASETIKVTIQRGLRYLEGPLSRRFRRKQKQFDNRYLSMKMYTDTFLKDKTSARGNTCAEGFVAGKPMKTKADAYVILEHACRKYGVPKLLVSNQAKE